jgi:murein DD-endopeptidase MepM/ murein hydrolase activator NlpD
MANPRQVHVAGRVIAVLVTLAVTTTSVLLTGGAVVSAAPSKEDVADARAAVTAVLDRIDAQQAKLVELGQQVNEINEDLLVAQDKRDAITNELAETREHRAEVQSQYDEVVGRLNQRARDAYVEGPGSELEFILGATSLTDLSDRVTFLDAVQQSDADLANEVENLRNELDTAIAKQEVLQAKAVDVVNELDAKKAALQANFDQQQEILDSIEQEKADAQAYYAKTKKKYQQWVKAQFGPTFGNGVLKVCPVDQPRSFGDGFGAPRYAGGYHLHKGVDIIAPSGTPIRAPFDGTARASSNTLGGLAVYVTGATGYVYNAHLSAYSSSSNGSVRAGDIIGYVGNTGDAQGGVTHDHFEYHPNSIPSPWPASAYGYSVIDDAINPYPLLVEACL